MGSALRFMRPGDRIASHGRGTRVSFSIIFKRHVYAARGRYLLDLLRLSPSILSSGFRVGRHALLIYLPQY